MAIQLINTGTTANDGTGDSLKAAGIKINENFAEIASVASADASPLIEIAKASGGEYYYEEYSVPNMRDVIEGNLFPTPFTLPFDYTSQWSPFEYEHVTLFLLPISVDKVGVLLLNTQKHYHDNMGTINLPNPFLPIKMPRVDLSGIKFQNLQTMWNSELSTPLSESEKIGTYTLKTDAYLPSSLNIDEVTGVKNFVIDNSKYINYVFFNNYDLADDLAPGEGPAVLNLKEAVVVNDISVSGVVLEADKLKHVKNLSVYANGFLGDLNLPSLQNIVSNLTVDQIRQNIEGPFPLTNPTEGFSSASFNISGEINFPNLITFGSTFVMFWGDITKVTFGTPDTLKYVAPNLFFDFGFFSGGGEIINDMLISFAAVESQSPFINGSTFVAFNWIDVSSLSDIVSGLTPEGVDALDVLINGGLNFQF